MCCDIDPTESLSLIRILPNIPFLKGIKYTSYRLMFWPIWRWVNWVMTYLLFALQMMFVTIMGAKKMLTHKIHTIDNTIQSKYIYIRVKNVPKAHLSCNFAHPIIIWYYNPCGLAFQSIIAKLSPPLAYGFNKQRNFPPSSRLKPK